MNQYGFNQPGELFFIQRWLEILHDKTHDSYHIKYLNSHLALKELILVCKDRINGKIKKNSYIEYLIKETRVILNNDIVLKNYANEYREVTFKNIEKIPKQIEDVYRLMYNCKHVVNYIEGPYLNWCIDELKQAIVSNDFNNINLVIQYLISELLDVGWSIESLYLELRGKLKQGWNLPDFLDNLKKDKEQYICLYKVKSFLEPEDFKLLTKLDLVVEKGQNIKGHYNNHDLHNFVKENSYFIKKEIMAYDYYSASDIGWEEINKKFDVLRFYGYKTPVLEKKPIVFTKDSPKVVANKEVLQVKLLKNYVAPLHMYDQFIHFLNREDVPSQSKTKVKQVFQCIRMSEESLSIESMFLNLWVALESFVKSPQYDEDIENVTKITAAIESHSYIYKLVKNLYEDCLRCEIELECGNIYDFFKLILSEDAEEKIVSKCGEVNTLLKYRANEIIQTLRSSKKVGALLKKHYDRITWHLRRIYRVRNDIVHSADYQLKNLHLFVRHLREYISILVPTSIYFINKFNYHSFEEVFSALVDNYKATIDILLKSENLNHKQYFHLLRDGALFSLMETHD